MQIQLHLAGRHSLGCLIRAESRLPIVDNFASRHVNNGRYMSPVAVTGVLVI